MEKSDKNAKKPGSKNLKCPRGEKCEKWMNKDKQGSARLVRAGKRPERGVM